MRVSSLFVYFLTIYVGPVISTSTRPIFTKFSGLVKLNDLKYNFRSLGGRCHGNQSLLALFIELSSGDIRQTALAYGKSSSAWVLLDRGG